MQVRAGGGSTLELPILQREATVSSVDVDARTVELVFSTGAAVMRSEWWTGKRFLETLSLKKEHVRLDRMNAGAAPLLDTHLAYSVHDILGAVEPNSVRLLAKEARVTVRFSDRAEVEPIWRDVTRRIIPSVSVGYQVFKYEETTGSDGKLPTRHAIDWEPYEVSMVPLPADYRAQVRAGDKSQFHPCAVVMRVDHAAADADRSRRFRMALARS